MYENLDVFEFSMILKVFSYNGDKT